MTCCFLSQVVTAVCFLRPRLCRIRLCFSGLPPAGLWRGEDCKAGGGRRDLLLALLPVSVSVAPEKPLLPLRPFKLHFEGFPTFTEMQQELHHALSSEPSAQLAGVPLKGLGPRALVPLLRAWRCQHGQAAPLPRCSLWGPSRLLRFNNPNLCALFLQPTGHSCPPLCNVASTITSFCFLFAFLVTYTQFFV